MTRARPETRDNGEILGYQLIWREAAQTGEVRVFAQGLRGSYGVRVKSLADLAALAEILRTEKPVFVRGWDKVGQELVIETGEEPAGEEDHG
jgi:hypothetical protein